MYTPWGKSQHQTQFGEGIVFHTTAGHGGFHVESRLLKLMPQVLQDFNPFTGKKGWFEEDCDWAIVAVAFPDRFEKPSLQAAVKTIQGSRDYFGEDVVEYVNSLSLVESPV